MSTQMAGVFPDHVQRHVATNTEAIANQDNDNQLVPSNQQHALFAFRRASSSSDDANASYIISNHGQHRFHQGLKLLDMTAKPKGTRARSQSSQGSGHGSDAAQSPSLSMMPFPATTRQEFESLPTTIQRKCFSTLERLRFASDHSIDESDINWSTSLDNLPRIQSNITPAASTIDDSTTTTNPSSALTPPASTAASSNAASPTTSLPDKKQSARLAVLTRLLFESTTTGSASTPASRPSQSALKRLHSSPASDRRWCSWCNTPASSTIPHSIPTSLPCSSPSAAWQSILLDATDEALIKRRKESRRAASLEMLSHRMHSCTPNAAWMDGRLKETESSLYDSFRWLEDDNHLDLSLDIDDGHARLPQDAANRESRSSSFCRKLSISSKMALCRASSSISRPSTKGAPTPFGGFVSCPQKSSINGQGHVRRCSHALSLISASRQSTCDRPAASPPPQMAMDPAAHYQDPEARMKLRVYLASPHKFDEAVEFGFPSSEQQPQSPISQSNKRIVDSGSRNTERNCQARMQTLVEDRRCSLYSDETTATEPNSPRTPDLVEKSDSFDVGHGEREAFAKADDYAPHSREMTLRMTLTRPDLRANEEQLYAWQKNSVNTSDVPHLLPLGPKSEEGDKKETIERQLAAIDEEKLLCCEQGAMKRLWNRVRRA